MNVLLVQISDYLYGGGGAIAGYRLHLGFQKAGIQSKVLSALKTVDSPDTVRIAPMTRLESYIGQVTRRIGLNDIHNISTFSIPKLPVFKQADILNIQGFRQRFSYMALPTLTRDKPAVFTLQDIWAFTGHCAVTYDCERWKTGCGNCPYLDVVPPVKRDATHIEWKLKERAYHRSNLSFVSLCSEVTERAKQSMLGQYPIYEIPGGLNTETLKPHDPELCRSLLGIPQDKHVIMFAALSVSQPWKGADLLIEALDGLPDSLKNESVLLLLGSKGSEFACASGMQVISYENIFDDRIKALLYSAADIFVSPTRAEAFGLVALESIACGTPSVTFAVGGARDYIREDISGYLAKPEDSQDLCHGLLLLLEDDALREKLGKLGREMVLNEYTMELQVSRYIELFQKILNKQQRLGA
jgi:glycosyltransferase involved in cell wall biosynthesis